MILISFELDQVANPSEYAQQYGGPIHTFYPGDRISGKVVLEVPKETKCKAVLIRLAFYLHGSGNEHVEILSEVRTHDGSPLKPGIHRFPFEFVLPTGPYTYNGTYTNLTWFIEAQLDIPWAKDPKDSIDFTLLPGPVDVIPESEKQSDATEDDNGVVAIVIAAVILIISLGWWALQIMDEDYISICGIFGVIVGGIAMFYGVHRFLSTRLVGAVEFSANPWPAHPGQTFTHTIKFTPRANMTVNQITATLTGTEVAVYGAGSDKTTYTEIVYEEQVLLCGDASLTKGELAVFKANYELPNNAPYSFEYPSNQIAWTLQTNIDIPNWPDWNDDREVDVAPDYRQLGPQASHDTDTSAPGSVW